MAVVFERPKSLIDIPTHYCPGCTHGIVHRILCEVIDEMGIEGDTIGVCPVGCSVMAYDYFNCDMIEAAHGRAPAVATGVKRTNPDKFVFTYQGDGDLAAIGTAETVHVATRHRPHLSEEALSSQVILLRSARCFHSSQVQHTQSALQLIQYPTSRLQRRLSARHSRTRRQARASLS